MKKILLLITALLSIALTADAKWWIFGKANTDVGVKYLYINGIAADETGASIKLFKETLPSGGAVKINGKAALGKGAVGSVRLTLDNKDTWTDVKFAENGTFEYTFSPEAGKVYTFFIEVTDTAGKTNNIEGTRKVIELSAENIQTKIRVALDTLFDAYNRENLQKFMAGVGENFAGDKAMLERAVKRDFDALSNIVMRYSINNVAAGAQGRVFVSVTYNRLVFVNKTGASNTDTGTTEFVFDSAEGKLSLFSMKQPLMFGLSDADNVASGVVLGGADNPLVLNDSGNLGGQLSYTSADGSFGFNIDDSAFEDCDGTAGNCSGHLVFMTGVPYMRPDDSPASALIGQIPGKNITSVTLADVQAAATQAMETPVSGMTYGLQYNAQYYAIEIVSLNGNSIALKTKTF